jgi:hypothetical protein
MGVLAGILRRAGVNLANGRKRDWTDQPAGVGV